MKLSYILRAFTLIAVLASLNVGRSNAQGRSELVGGSDSSLRFSGDSKDLGIDFGYYYLVAPEAGIQLGLDSLYDYASQGSVSETSWGAVIGVRFNILPGEDLSNKIFLGAGLGLTRRGLRGASNDVKFTW